MERNYNKLVQEISDTVPQDSSNTFIQPTIEEPRNIPRPKRKYNKLVKESIQPIIEQSTKQTRKIKNMTDWKGMLLNTFKDIYDVVHHPENKLGRTVLINTEINGVNYSLNSYYIYEKLLSENGVIPRFDKIDLGMRLGDLI
jgi:uncharacterized protein YlzI (FlbEa/FlbD family)